MAVSVAQELHVAGRGHGRSVPMDSGARLSYALLSYLVVLITALTLMPFEFAVPDRIEPELAFVWLSTLAQLAMFVPYGFFMRRTRTGRPGQQHLAIALSSGLFALVLETAQLFEPARDASPWHLLAAVAGAVTGSFLCERAHNSADTSANALNSLLLQLPLMGLVYLLIPLLWASGAASQEDPARLALTLCVGLTGASILGSIARAVRGYTPDRPWWLVPTVAFTWITVGVLPSVLTDWRLVAACTVIVTAFAAWRGRWSAPMFVERRYEAPSLLAASPFMALYFIGAGIWPGHSFRSIPLLHLGVPTTESGLALALPLLEAVISATVLGYVVAEFHGRSESTFRDGSSRVLFWVMLVIIATETMRSFFGYEGASLARAGLSVGAAMYGAGLYHLQRTHVKVVARRLHSRG